MYSAGTSWGLSYVTLSIVTLPHAQDPLELPMGEHMGHMLLYTLLATILVMSWVMVMVPHPLADTVLPQPMAIAEIPHVAVTVPPLMRILPHLEHSMVNSKHFLLFN